MDKNYTIEEMAELIGVTIKTITDELKKEGLEGNQFPVSQVSNMLKRIKEEKKELLEHIESLIEETKDIQKEYNLMRKKDKQDQGAE